VQQDASQLDVFLRNQNNGQSEKESLNQWRVTPDGDLELSLQQVV
jgi:hypothetical protein